MTTALTVLNSVKTDYLRIPTTDTTTYVDATFLRIMGEYHDILASMTRAWAATTTTVTTADGTQLYAVADTNGIVRGAYIAGQSPMSPISEGQCIQDAALTSKGVPRYWCQAPVSGTNTTVYHTAIKLSPIPDGIYSVVVTIEAIATKPSATGSTLDLEPLAIVPLHPYIAAELVGGEDPQQAAVWMAEYERKMAQYIEHTQRRFNRNFAVKPPRYYVSGIDSRRFWS